jgi:hypothetical protein
VKGAGLTLRRWPLHDSRKPAGESACCPMASVSSEAARQQLRRVVSVEDHDFPSSLCGRRLGLVDSGVILNPLFGPRRCIAVPVVLYCYTQEIVSRHGRPPQRCLANMVRRFETMSRLPHRL